MQAVVAPSEQAALDRIADQQVHVDHGSHAGDKLEDGFGQPAGRSRATDSKVRMACCRSVIEVDPLLFHDQGAFQDLGVDRPDILAEMPVKKSCTATQKKMPMTSRAKPTEKLFQNTSL